MFLCLGGFKEDTIFDDDYKKKAFNGGPFNFRAAGASSQAKDFLRKLLEPNHYKRALISEIKDHEWL